MKDDDILDQHCELQQLILECQSQPTNYSKPKSIRDIINVLISFLVEYYDINVSYGDQQYR